MIRNKYTVTLLGMMLCAFFGGFAFASEQSSWIEGERVRVQTLDKITARIGTIEANIDDAISFGTLEIKVRYCAFRPPEIPPEHAAFVEIVERAAGDNQPLVPDKPIFAGWMFASSPAISGLEHPVYDLTLLNCSK